jgi:hypothetical protein
MKDLMAQPRRPSVLALLLKLAGGFIASVAFCGLLARLQGFPPTLWPTIAGMAFWVILGCVIAARWHKAGRKGQFALELTIGLALIPLFWFQIFSLQYFQPRPVFHNGFYVLEMKFVPAWHPSRAEWDEFGQYVRADYRDNLLVVILTGASPGADQPLWGGLTDYTVRVGAEDGYQTITLPRIKDAFVLVSPDGTHQQFPLEPGWAEFFHGVSQMNAWRMNLLRSSRAALDEASKTGFDAAIADYREPLPPRPVFHNEHKSEIPPAPRYWRLTTPRSDPLGSQAWADYEDNLLVIVKDAVRLGQDGRKGFATYHAERFRFFYGGSHWAPGAGSVKVPRTRDAMIVVRPDLSTRRFHLEAGAAEQFHRSTLRSDDGNLLHEAAGLLPETERLRFEEFVGREALRSASQPVSQPS